ncbi:hypothetical protein E1B28_013019 [Marasmius oreades]|uniref:F-box domain-containing protein n=1 Tax=Marasmius oreades TaxID=181124 RepID=A0A9P7RPQ7_9AGAR|nr:uncharacterized protein E1B28_013019 [Marasmius oreades]KAG7087040.1 hypothetical protein E1B28_013019 [Marasmius oreades]
MTTIGSLAPETIIHILRTASQLELQQNAFDNLPLTIPNCSEVSRRWRSIVSKAPTVFTNIIVPFEILRIHNYSIRSWINFWLEHSKPLPITLLSILPRSLECEDFEAFRQMWCDFIIPNVSRLERYHFHLRTIRFTHQSQYAFLRALRHVDAPILNDIHIRVGCEKDRRLYKPLYSLFRSIPNLRKVVLYGFDRLPPLTHELRELDIYRVELSNTSFQRLATVCQRLEVLTLRSIWVSKGSLSDDSPTPIKMDSLRTLTLNFEDVGPFVKNANLSKHYLTHVLAPNLEYLEVSPAELSRINLFNMLPNPSSLTSLRTLKLVGVSKTVQRQTVSGDMDNSIWFKSLPSSNVVEEIHLSHSSGEVLGIDFPIPDSSGEPRSGDELRDMERLSDIYYIGRSQKYEPNPVVDSMRPSSSTASLTNLKSLTVETLVAEDMVWMCRLITVRPTIRMVWLSESALLTLRTSLILWEDRDSGRSFIKIQKPGYMGCEFKEHVEEKGVDVERWVKERVELRILGSS